MVWALEAAALGWIGAKLEQRRATQGAIAIFALVLLRLFFLDSWMYAAPGDYRAFANARFATFVLAAACFWIVARWMAGGVLALPVYVAGHLVVMWGMGLEVTGWAARTASPENFANVRSAALSVLMAAYAVLLVGLGVFTGTLVNRALGLGLIAAVVIKLYLHDVWRLGLFYRMAAFAALGALLLAMSFLYSRFRPAIESWWRERRS
jgi:hypothetical protein